MTLWLCKGGDAPGFQSLPEEDLSENGRAGMKEL